MLRTLLCLVVVLFGLLLCALPAQAGLRHVWAVDDGEKIFQNDLTNPLQSGEGNTVWDGTKVRLFAARNEIVACQLILEGDDFGASQVDVHVSDLVNGTTHIRGSHPLFAPNDYRGLGVELFAEHYFDITQCSWDGPLGGFDCEMGFTPETNPHITGLIPDALVPFAATQGLGGAPFDIAPNLNQGVWMDIYVPRDAPTGLYSGTISITINGGPATVLPIEVEVFTITLSDENHYQSMVWFSGYNIEPRHSTGGCCSSATQEMILDYHRMAHRHRIELIDNGTFSDLTPFQGTLTGEAFTAAHNYEGPGEGVGNKIYSINTYGVQFPDDEADYWAYSDAWVNWFTANAPHAKYFLYLCDEPGESAYDWIRERASWIHDNPGPGGDLPVFMTRWPIDSLVGAIDLWCCPPNFYNHDDATAAIARGEEVWLYASARPMTPADVTDEYGMAWRLKAWIGHQRQIPVWFTWEATHWDSNGNELGGWHYKNVWIDPATFVWDPDHDGVPTTSGIGNGDGTLFYPGQDALFPDQDRGYAGPVSSIRMKMYRRGIQDVEYTWLAEQAGQGVETQALLAELAPKTLWEAPTLPEWSNANRVYEGGRWRLSNMLSPHRPFLDVPWDQWAKTRIEACAAAGVVSGYNDGTYQPQQVVTRDQMAVFVARALAEGDGNVPAGPATPTFPDVGTEYWAYRYVEYVKAEKIVSGYPDGKYGPDLAVDRGQMAVFMARAISPFSQRPGLPGYLPPAMPSFLDVRTDFWAYKEIELVKERDVVSGYPDGAYRPNLACTRDQMAVFVAQAFGLI